MNTKLVLTALLISSLLSAAFFHFFPFYLLFIPIPGIIFGIIMVIIYNLLNFPVTKLRSFLVIMFSSLGMLSATWIYWYSFAIFPEQYQRLTDYTTHYSSQYDNTLRAVEFGGFLLASISGAIITLIPNIFKSEIKQSWFWYFLGLVLALIVGLFNAKFFLNEDNEHYILNSILLFTSWQIIIGYYIILIKHKFVKTPLSE